MKRTYITKVPDKVGAFLKASEIISSLGGNIIRVSYNKAVDIHTLFIDVFAEENQITAITQALEKLGYLSGQEKENRVILIELKLLDIAGMVTPVLELLSIYNVNISYMSSTENGTEYQYFKMGLLIENISLMKNLLDDISKLCVVRILEYQTTEKLLDNTVFYLSFANDMRNLLSLSQEQTNEFMINSNKIMQMLDDRNEKPLKTFEYVYKFAKFMVEHKASNFNDTINRRQISECVTLYMIEPPCGANTYILEGANELLFIDCGFACYSTEMTLIFNKLFNGFDTIKKSIILTHADIDHAGLLSIFDSVFVSKSCYDNFLLENQGEDNFREQNAYHAAYCKLSRIISGYTPPPLEKIKIIGEKQNAEPLSKIGEFVFEDLSFTVYEGNGGHVKGETILICEDKKLMFTGDNLVNIKGFSEEQRQFNLLAPYLMTSVNVNSQKASLLRELLFEKSKGYLVCPGHGEWMDN